MTRYEAHIEKGWHEHGLAHVLVARIRDDGSADFGVFLVDVFCLGVKDAFLEADVPASEQGSFVAANLPGDRGERLHPACAKKLIDGAIAYAEGLGFAPARDFRKTRRVLSGVDAARCPTEFTFGCNGRPCYIQGQGDSAERVERVLAMLEARCGPDGFDYELADDEDNAEDAREDLILFFEAEPEGTPGFFEFCGMVSAMLICPSALSPTELAQKFWGPGGRVWRDEEELNDFLQSLRRYWNYLAGVVLACSASVGEEPVTDPIDVYEEDFENPHEMAFAIVEWAHGFLRATREWPEAWGDAMVRTDLVPHWNVVRAWADPEQPDNLDSITAAGVNDDAEHPRKNLPLAVTALARALRPAGPSREEGQGREGF